MGVQVGDTWIVDLDGVVWRGLEPIAGADVGVAALRAAGVRVVFATNNSSPSRDELVARLAAAGISAVGGDVVTSADAAATLVPEGGRALVVGDAGIREALEVRSVELCGAGPVDAVVVGFTRSFDFDSLTRAVRAVRAGAVLIGTNADVTYPVPDGVLPGGGALLAAVAAASEVTPVVAGKPNAPMVELLRGLRGQCAVVVGDRPSTDGALARALGCRFGLVLSGVTVGELDAGLNELLSGDLVSADLGTLVREVLGE